jgi:hypothetical protein
VTPWTREELVEWLNGFAPPDARDAVNRLIADVESSVREVVRLQRVVSDHTDKLCRPIVSSYVVNSTIKHDASYYTTKASIELRPIKYEITVPLVIKGWTEDYKTAFYKQVVEGVSMVAGEALTKNLWPDECRTKEERHNPYKLGGTHKAD